MRHHSSVIRTYIERDMNISQWKGSHTYIVARVACNTTNSTLCVYTQTLQIMNFNCTQLTNGHHSDCSCQWPAESTTVHCLHWHSVLCQLLQTAQSDWQASWCGSGTLCLHIGTLSWDCVCESLVCICCRLPLHLKGSSTEDDQTEIGRSCN